jgi:hypothetical protein
VRLVDEHSNEVVPLGHVPALAEDAQEGDVRFQGRRYSYVDGEFRVDPRRLPLQYQVLKGYEYGIAGGDLTATLTRDGTFTIPLSRWSAVADRGWYSGDIHIHHIAPKTCRLEMDAEDLNVANILTSDFTRDQAEFEGKLNAYSSGKSLIYVNQEFRSDHFGHMCVLNLKQLIEPVAIQQPYAYPLHAQVCDRVHAQGGYVSWAHFPSMPALESPLDVAHGETGWAGDSVRAGAAGTAGLRPQTGTGNGRQQRAAHVVSVFELRLSVGGYGRHR